MSTNDPTPTDWLGHPIPAMSPELAARLQEAADADMAQLRADELRVEHPAERCAHGRSVASRRDNPCGTPALEGCRVDDADPMPPELPLRSIMAAREELLTHEVRQLNAHLARIADALEQIGLAR